MGKKWPASREPQPGELLRDRLFLYIRALRIPPREGLALVAEALDTLRASGMQDVSFPDARDLETAMGVLRTLCAEQGLLPKADAFPCSFPLYNRGSMPPAHISVTRQGGSPRAPVKRGPQKTTEGGPR